MSFLATLSSGRRRSRVGVCFLPIICLLVVLSYLYKSFPAGSIVLRSDRVDGVIVADIVKRSQEFAQIPVGTPYKDKLWETGQRSQQLKQWIRYIETTVEGSKEHVALVSAVEKGSASLFSFIQPAAGVSSSTPLLDLLNIVERGSQGIIIPIDGPDINIRLAGHLIVTLRHVMGSQLPIEVVYAGDNDLPKAYREALASLDGTGRLTFVNLRQTFKDLHLHLDTQVGAIKPFAALASRFEQVIIANPDTVLLQEPEKIFKQQLFVDTGVYLFHDRQLRRNAINEKHDWWRDQIQEHSFVLDGSSGSTHDYAAECDSGVVVLDKSRLDVFIGLLHAAWQNTDSARNEVDDTVSYGEKEAWWLSMELTGSTYGFEEQHGSIVGWVTEHSRGEDGRLASDVCGSTVAHTDSAGNLLWYSGSLLKNKLKYPNDYEVPEAWMQGGTWQSGSTDHDMSCMVGATAKRLSGSEQSILRNMIEGAWKADEVLKAVEP